MMEQLDNHTVDNQQEEEESVTTVSRRAGRQTGNTAAQWNP